MLIATLDRQRRARAAPTTPAALFVCGYVLVWTAFSLAAASAQWTLHHAALLAPSMASTSRALSGALLVVAGVYQWLPAKYACLTHCRSPFGFVTTEWREGPRGAVIMGLRHGAICLGCCWALMALLFVAGVMNVLWIAVLATLVLLEKLVPAGVAIARGAGLAFIAWGAWLLLPR
jgi:predicted metal-binding membrane protein